MNPTVQNDNSRLKAYVVLALAGALWIDPPLQAASPQVEIGTVRETWQLRQQKVRSFKCVSVTQVFNPKEWRQAAASRPSPIPSVLPPGELEDVEYEYRHVLIVDGNRMRIESDEPVTIGFGSNALEKRQYTSVFDGQTQTTLRNAANFKEGGEFLQANLRATAETDRDQPSLMPPLVTFRGNDLEHGSLYTNFDLRTFVVTTDVGEVDGHSCVILRRGREYLWLDPRRDFIMLRLLLMQPDMKGIAVQCDISYTDHSEAGWVPTEWRFVHLMPDGRLKSHAAGRVTQIAINTDFPGETFTLQIPPGTSVSDARKDPENPIHCIQLDDACIEVPITGTYNEALTRAKRVHDANKRQAAEARWQTVSIGTTAVVVSLALGLLWWFRRSRT